MLLSTSSFRLQSYLNQQIQSNHFTASQLAFAVSLNIKSGQYKMLERLQKGSRQWLAIARDLAKTDGNISWQLAVLAKQKDEQRDHQFWFKQALEQGSIMAINAYAEDAIEQLAFAAPPRSNQLYQQAKSYLNLAIEQSDRDGFVQSVTLSVELAVGNGDSTWFAGLLPLLKATDKPELRALYAQLSDFSIIKGDTLNLQALPIKNQQYSAIEGIERPNQCAYPIQFFAGDLRHLQNLNQKLNRINHQAFFSEHFCFLPPKYLAHQQMQCDHQATGRIDCKVEKPLQKHREAGFMGFVTNPGNANVNNGTLFIDDFDSAQVIEHELLHLIGYIDEYPLPKQHSACLQNDTVAIAKNIVVDNQSVFSGDMDARQQLKDVIPWFSLIKEQTPITHKTDKGYVLGTPKAYRQEVGVFLANTCQRQKQNAFKAVFQPTKLEYFEADLPTSYQHKTLSELEKFHMPLSAL